MLRSLVHFVLLLYRMIEGFGNILVHKCWFPIEAIYYPMHDLDTFAEIKVATWLFWDCALPLLCVSVLTL